MASQADPPSASTATQRDFHHPYTPYKIQLDFMNALYDTIEEGKIGIFESPTGTGKSLSLICGAMTWLRDHQSLSLQEESSAGDDTEPAWVREYHANLLREKRLKKYRDLQARIDKVRALELKDKQAVRARGRMFGSDVPEGVPKRAKTGSQNERAEDRYLVDDYHSDDEDVPAKSSGGGASDSNLSKEVQALLKRLGGNTGDNEDEEDEEFDDNDVKIFYASRTHSQLSQFVQQLRLPNFPPSELWSSAGSLRHVPLSSRKQLCIHPRISRLRDLNAINDRCTELQQNSGDNRCSFMMNEHELADRVKSRDFRDKVIAEVRDIEDMADIGRSMSVCPYYASRGAVQVSEIVTLPYPLLLQSSYRKALSISLKNQIVIIDEAHNLLDAITSLFSMSISLTDIKKSKSGVQVYLNKFSKKLNGGNKVYITQIIKLLEVLEQFLSEFKGVNGTEVVQNDVLQSGSVDTINVFKIEKYMEKSKLSRKVESYIVHLAEQAEMAAMPDGKENKRAGHKKFRQPPAAVPLLSKIMSFLMALTNPTTEGRVFFELANGEKHLKYLLLDPSFHFKSIVEEARCVILAGGTMEPVSDYLRYLFPYVPRDRFKLVSCDHVIPKQNLGAWTIATGPTGAEMVFTFERQRLEATAIELGRTISNLTCVIPDGMVLFFPSYKYMAEVCAIWKRTVGGHPSQWEQISKRKTIFEEPREASEVDHVLSEYASVIEQDPADTGKRTRGAILLAVVGGKMSEGINFSDKLARGIVMVGLPFPNARSADMVAKRRYVEEHTIAEVKARGMESLRERYPEESLIPDSELTQLNQLCRKEAETASREYYENVCMRAVNQSIGRGIRHANDYAVIIFVDARFASERITRKLPKWINERMPSDAKSVGLSVGNVMRYVSEFFRDKKEVKSSV
ncbi:helicase C-terminal domain-containing protein [Myxozyma melibiosi]|uniref:ATP-dependent DNA helicase CHL1 n=1 Tax=Myxozyma melibiosi TaxID=54550 RepID=A0ABR1F6J4_9ASCO